MGILYSVFKLFPSIYYMRTLTHFIAVAIVLFVFSSCNLSNKVKLVTTNCKGEIEQYSNFTFSFNKNLISDSILENTNWLNEKFVKFTPDIKGSFRWENKNTLIFSPISGLPPATSFTAEISDAVCKYSNYQLGNTAQLTFHTPTQKLSNFTAQWAIGNVSTQEIAIFANLEFAFPQSATNLNKLIRVKVNGKETPFTYSPTSDFTISTIVINGIKPLDREYKIEVNIEKGLVPIDGKMESTKILQATATLTSPFTLSIDDYTSSHNGLEGTVHLLTSQKVVSKDLKSFIKISPQINFDVIVTDEGLQITSADFDVSEVYQLLVKKGLKGIVGGELKEDYITSIGFKEAEPDIAFLSNDETYLSAKGNKNILVNIVNIKEVEIVVRKIYENNILTTLHYGTESYYDYGDESSFSTSDIIYKEVIPSQTLPMRGEARILNFDFKDKFADIKGIYSITIRSTEDYWLSASRIISVSDIGLIARQTENDIVLFANSIKTANALNRVECKVYGVNNQLIGSGFTDNNGNAVIRLKSYDAAGFSPALITARNESDFTYLSLKNSRIETSRFDVGGKNINASDLDAFVYGERDMYRPGERIYLSAVVRTANWKIPEKVPFKMTLKLPNGQVFQSLQKTLNEQASFEVAFDLPANAVTGSYLYELYTPNDVLIASKSLLVEEFMPDRIKVNTKLNKTSLMLKDSVVLNGTVLNLFGTAASHRNYEVDFMFKKETLKPKNYSKYDFELKSGINYFSDILREEQTDADGNFKEVFQLPQDARNQGIVKAKIYTTVFDETGRPVNRYNEASIFTQNIFVGILKSDYYHYPLNQNIRLGLIALDINEKAVAAPAKVVVLKHEYNTVLAKNWNYFRYESQEENKVIATQNIQIAGENTTFNFVPRSPGDYEVRVYLPNGESYVKQAFYSYGSWGGSTSNFEVNKEGNVSIESDKSYYQTGENAQLLFKAPFNGKMLVTIERDNVLEKFYLNVENRTATASIHLKQSYLPNVYVTATLFKPHTESNMPLTVAHGFKNISVSEPARKINVKINAQEKVRSNTHQKVSVKTSPNSFITLAAVDEGVLQITDYKTPDPYGYFYDKRALNVSAYDFYANLFPETKSVLSSVGGDGFDLSRRTNPLPNKRVKLMRYWSGIKKADDNGNAFFEFDVPQFSGSLRLMAVSYKNENFGFVETSMKVADPLILSTGMPRFLSPNDEADISLTLTNATATAITVKLAVETEGALSLVDFKNKTWSIPANTEKHIMFKVKAKSQIGEAKVSVKADVGNEIFTDVTDITVRPSASLQKISGSGEVAAGETKIVTLGSSDFIRGTEKYDMLVSNSPLATFGKNLSDLIRYPHGCTEQITAAAFPQIYFSELSNALNKSRQGAKSASNNVIEAIKKIKMRQLYSGGIALWDNDDSEHWWTSVFAAHFLVEAKCAGYNVDDDLLEPLLQFLKMKLRNKETYNYYFNRGQHKMIAAREIPYSLYVLSLAGTPQKSTMNYYKSKRELLTSEGKFLLAAAYALGGDKSKINELLPDNFADEVSDKDVSSNFSSSLRDEALALTVLLKVQAENKRVPEMVKHVSEGLKANKYLSTQEMVFSLTALGQFARQNTASNVNATVKANGKVIANVNDNSVKISSKQLNTNQLEISVNGTGKLYYFWEASGISKSGNVKEEDNYLKVRRTFYDRYGKIITQNEFKQNDLIVVKISLENNFARDIENVVITDMLPAAFEIENPRIKEIPGTDWIKDDSSPIHTDIRDDRINLFVNIDSKKKKNYYYVARAVSLGTFSLGTLSADAMYAGEYHSYSGSGTIKVKEQ